MRGEFDKKIEESLEDMAQSNYAVFVSKRAGCQFTLYLNNTFF